jgi:hypothetical protein
VGRERYNIPVRNLFTNSVDKFVDETVAAPKRAGRMGVSVGLTRK